MEFQTPHQTGYTIYSKSGCLSCTKVKVLLEDEQTNQIDCDKYLTDDNIKKEFLEFIKKLANKSFDKFPMVFKDGVFIGGFIETKDFYDKARPLNDDF
jgi:glutaredoxin